MVCLMAALFFTGVLLGRLSDDAAPAGHIYLNETAPPAAAAKTTTPSPRKAQSHVGRIEREETSEAPRGQSSRSRTTRPSASPKDEVRGFTVDDPARMLGGEEIRSAPEMASKVVSLTNSARAKKGCRPLRIDTGLTRSARAHSLEMARSGRFAHDSPDGSSPWERMERAGYQAGAAENIGRGYTSPEEAVSGWLGNPAHRQNILNCRIRAIGVGVVHGPGGPWWTQDFGYS